MNGKQDIMAQLSALIDGELTQAEASRAEEAARRDETVAAELRRLRATRRFVRDLPRVAAPGDLADRVLQRVERRHLLGDEPARAPGQPFRAARYLSAAAAMLLAAGVAFIVLLTVHLSRRPADELAATVPEPPGPTVLGPRRAAESQRPDDLRTKAHPMPNGRKGRDFGGMKESGEGGGRDKQITRDAKLPKPIAHKADAGTFRFLVQPVAGREANHLVILTNDLAAADRRVKELLCSALPAGTSRAGGWRDMAGSGEALDYHSRARVQNDREVQYEVLVPANDVPRFREQLGALAARRRRASSPGSAAEDAAGAGEQGHFPLALAKTGAAGGTLADAAGLPVKRAAGRGGTDEAEKTAEAAPAAGADEPKDKGGLERPGPGAEPPRRPVESPEPKAEPAVPTPRAEPPQKSLADQPSEPQLQPAPAPTPPGPPSANPNRPMKAPRVTVGPVTSVAGAAGKPGELPPPEAKIERHPAKRALPQGIGPLDLAPERPAASQPGPVGQLDTVKAKAHPAALRPASGPAVAADAQAPPRAATAPAPVRIERLVITLRLDPAALADRAARVLAETRRDAGAGAGQLAEEAPPAGK